MIYHIFTEYLLCIWCMLLRRYKYIIYIFMCKLKYFHMSDIYVSYIHLYTIYSLYISNIHYNTKHHTRIRIDMFYLLPASNKVCVFAQTYIQQQIKPNTDVANFTSHTITFKERVSDLYIQM